MADPGKQRAGGRGTERSFLDTLCTSTEGWPRREAAREGETGVAG